ncbi:MAG: hypothetical protein JST92_22265 [Deltaproteobacteria bacterium]|nr:hypothetical protein [Deltaproteobacteria bacterium]
MNGSAKVDPAGGVPQVEVRFGNCAGDFQCWMYDAAGANPSAYAAGTSSSKPFDLLKPADQVGRALYLEAYAGHGAATAVSISVTLVVKQDGKELAVMPQPHTLGPDRQATFSFVVEFTK